ncbi:hypothetical protein HanIR_Chr05g0240081 [Helianthus annuus]|nr:hypothetical protein HanIR_Chr05g0240081 [Helianthus annuus]
MLYASDYVQYLLSVQYKFWDSSYVSICFSARISVSVFSICPVSASVFVLELFCFQYRVAQSLQVLDYYVFKTQVI